MSIADCTDFMQIPSVPAINAVANATTNMLDASSDTSASSSVEEGVRQDRGSQSLPIREPDQETLQSSSLVESMLTIPNEITKEEGDELVDRKRKPSDEPIVDNITKKKAKAKTTTTKNGGRKQTTKKPAAKTNNAKKAASSKKGAANGNNANNKKGSSKSTAKGKAKSGATPKGPEPPLPDLSSPSAGLDLYTKHYREFERTVARLEKVDQFGYFWDPAPPEFDEQYPSENDTAAAGVDDATESAVTLSGVDETDKSPGKEVTRIIRFPSYPPFNWEMIRRRRATGRYIWDLQQEEDERIRQCAIAQNVSIESLKRIPLSHPKGIHWDLFRQDVLAMCDGALERNQDAGDGTTGTLAYAVKKIKNNIEQVRERAGQRQINEISVANDRHRFAQAMERVENKNTEAAFQGEWRRHPFPERKYERLRENVVCAGLSELDERIASYELRTNLPDSFVGLSYKYEDDTGKSEAWMKSVLTQTGDRGTKDKEAKQAAMALAEDAGVIRAQVTTCIEQLLIAVQDKVMTEDGVLRQLELRSANWETTVDDSPPVENATCCETTGDGDRSAKNESRAENLDSSTEVVEQPVWGIDCYTRRNISICMATEFTQDTALVFIEKWLLPAINACPVDLAHDISNAALILEGLPFTTASFTDENESNATDPKQAETEERWSHSLLGQSLMNKIRTSSPSWLKDAARLLRRARTSLGPDFFRVHPKGHGSIVVAPVLEPNTLVTFYRGEVYPSWRWGEKMDAIEITQKRKQLKPNLPDFYNMALERPQKDPRRYGLLFVDASRKAGHGSSLSHSCAPTCEVRVASVNGELCLAMTTLRRIEMGEELTFDYNAVTESLIEYRSAVCLCGYGKCRGSFLHFATADCYQQVLNRNYPLAVRFANLAKGCMKEVMSEEDERCLYNHGFWTAAFGAVSVNRHKASGFNLHDTTLDSMDIVPVWLRTYVADTLRYIEYERRALPISLICEHAENFTEPSIGTATGEASATFSHNQTGEEKNASGEEPDDRSAESVKVSKPMPSFFFYAKSKQKYFHSLLEKDGLTKDISGLELRQRIQKIAGSHWKLLTDKEKASWKRKAMKEWQKNGGASAKSDEKGKTTKTKPSKETKIESKLKSSKISFQAADAEGSAAMEQRIQQLSQSLSRVGRVLDRHREDSFGSESHFDTASSTKLRDHLHPPLSVASDEQIVAWMWNHEDGIVRSLLAKADAAKCASPSLKNSLRSIEEKYQVLRKFGRPLSVSSGVSEYPIQPHLARQKVTCALLELRKALLLHLRAMEKDLKARKAKKKPADKTGTLQKQTLISVDDRPSSAATLGMGAIGETTLEEKEGGRPASMEHIVLDPEGSDSSKDHSGPVSNGDKRTVAHFAGTQENVKIEVAAVLHDLVDQVVSRAGTEASGASVGAAENDHGPLQDDEEETPRPWLEHYHERFMLQAAADLLLLYAKTSTFFLLRPYKPLESTPIEVYARELGNSVPRSVIDNLVAQKCPKENSNRNQDPSHEVPTPATFDDQSLPQTSSETKKRRKGGKDAKKSSDQDLCQPDEVVAHVTIDYQGDFVVSQLLQWYNGGIGQAPGMPDVLGCVRLPFMSGCWESNPKLTAKAKREKLTSYEKNTRPKLIQWLNDPHQRGSPWPEEIRQAFTSDTTTSTPADTSAFLLPFGSPILDLLVTGDDASISAILEAFGAETSTSSDSAKGLLSTVDQGRPAQATVNWVQCENPLCGKWRKIPWNIDIDVVAKKFVCSDNKWNPASNSCDAPEDSYEDADNEVVAGAGVTIDSDALDVTDEIAEAVVDEDTIAESSGAATDKETRLETSKSNKNETVVAVDEATILPNARFDVLRSEKKDYTTGIVVEVKRDENQKMVLFHFERTQSRFDEWVEIGSIRIAPLYSKPRAKKANRKRQRGASSERVTDQDSSNLAKPKALSSEYAGALDLKQETGGIAGLILAAAKTGIECSLSPEQKAKRQPSTSVDHAENGGGEAKIPRKPSQPQPGTFHIPKKSPPEKPKSSSLLQFIDRGAGKKPPPCSPPNDLNRIPRKATHPDPPRQLTALQSANIRPESDHSMGPTPKSSTQLDRGNSSQRSPSQSFIRSPRGITSHFSPSRILDSRYQTDYNEKKSCRSPKRSPERSPKRKLKSSRSPTKRRDRSRSASPSRMSDDVPRHERSRRHSRSRTPSPSRHYYDNDRRGRHDRYEQSYGTAYQESSTNGSYYDYRHYDQNPPHTTSSSSQHHPYYDYSRPAPGTSENYKPDYYRSYESNEKDRLDRRSHHDREYHRSYDDRSYGYDRYYNDGAYDYEYERRSRKDR